MAKSLIGTLVPLTPAPSPRKEGKGKTFWKPLPLYGGGVWGGGIRLILTLLTLCFITLVQINAAYAQATPTPVVTDNQVNQIARGLYCPVCQNIPLEVCETAACAEWRQQVRDLIAQGYNEQQIRDYFVQRFGPQTVGVPTNSTAQALTIALPAALIALIGVLIAVNLLIWRRRNATVNEAPGADIQRQPLDEYRARLEEELRKKD